MEPQPLESVLGLYCRLPDTPNRYRSLDRQLAQRWLDQGVRLTEIRAAFLLATLRRHRRPDHRERLPTIRSLAYFEPVLREIQQRPLAPEYLDYLERAFCSL